MSRAEDFSDNLLFKAKPFDEGYNGIVSRGEKGLKHLDFGMLYLTSGEWCGYTGDCEQVLDIHRGVVSMGTWDINRARLGGRESVFDGPPEAVYLAPETSYTVRVVEGPVEIAVTSALATGHAGESILVEDVPTEFCGRDNWRAEMYEVAARNFKAAKLVVIEIVTGSGNWSSEVSHKHDACIPPRELAMEEICYFRVDPPNGYGIIRIHTEPNDPGPMDEVYVIEDGDLVVIPRGFHIFGSAPGCSLHATTILAGDRRP
jgi:5-deoxy-glucuronate isomerase